ALAGLGSGAVYTTCVGIAVKWFKDNRGLAVGLVAAGFGAGAALTIIPVRMMIAASGYQSAFFWLGLIQGGVILIVARFIRAPHPGEAPAVTAVRRQTTYSYSTRQMLRTPVLWVLHMSDLMICAGGLMFPAMCADLFGPQYATANLSVLYTAKGVGAFLVPLGTVLVASTGSWDSVLLLGAGINVVATILALAVLRPAENRHHTDEQQGDLMQSALAGRPS